MKTNRLKELLKAGKPTLGTRMVIPWPRVVEIIGGTGNFDYIEYSAVVSPWNFELLENVSRAFELFPNMSSTIKVGPEEREFLAPRAVHAGFQNVKFAEVTTAEELRACMRLIRPETPELGGKLSWGTMRVGGLGGVDLWMKAMAEVGVFVVIEKQAAVDNLEEILSVPGIDMVSFGGTDYAINIGKPGKQRSPEVTEVEVHVAKTAMKKGIPFRCHLHGDFEDAKPWLEMGIRHFFICVDQQSIGDECRHQGGGMRKLLASV